MTFIPAYQPPTPIPQQAHWFVFQDKKLLVCVSENSAEIPLVSPSETEWGASLRYPHYLGTLDGQPCYVGEVGSAAVAPEGMEFRGLRSLFGLLPEVWFALSGTAIQVLTWDQDHKFCGRCAHRMNLKTEERAKLCPECGLTSYPRISPAIIVAIVRDGEILLARAPRFPEHMYSVIAGFVEIGESLEECVHREVKEEVGVDVTDVHYFGSQPWPFPHSIMIGFTAKYAGGDIVCQEDEIADAQWFTPHNLPYIPGKISIARKLIDWFLQQQS